MLPLGYASSPPYSGPKCAWVVFLLTFPSYLPGILVLAHSLRKHKSKYPLIAAVNSALPSETRTAMEGSGLEVRVVEPLVPKGEVTIIAERFVDTWTKLAVFDFTEYDRLVLIDGDMMVRRNMDELFNLPMERDEIAATYACVCNVPRSDWAPDDWTRENCGFTTLDTRRRTHDLLNSGIVVLTPSHSIMSRITSLLTSTAPSDQAKIRSWMFPDQDLLSDLFFDKWIKLPWYYNALKTMRYWHGKFFRDEDVRNLHYIVDKPWQRRPQRNDEGMRKETGCVFRVEPGEFGEVNDESGGYTLGLPAHEADAVTHGWWWEEYEEMVVEMRETGYSKWEYLEGLVAK